MKIQKNIGNVSRAIRVFFGSVMLLFVPLAFVGPESGWALLGILGVFPLVMGLIGFCPRKALFRRNAREGNAGFTNENDESREHACC